MLIRKAAAHLAMSAGDAFFSGDDGPIADKWQ